MVRFKNRYMLVELNLGGIPQSSSITIRQEIVYRTIIDTVKKLHGDYGVGAIRDGLLVKYCNLNLRVILVRARRGPHRYLLTCFPFITKICNKNVTLKCLYVGATIRCSLKFLIKHQKEKLIEEYKRIKGSDNFKNLFKEVLDKHEKCGRMSI